MLTDLTAERPLSSAIVERAEADLALITTYLRDRLQPHYPKATISIVLLGGRASYHIDPHGHNRSTIVYGFRAADAEIDTLLDVRPMTFAEIERTLGTDTAYTGNHHAA
jgi:hypothetical protein